MSYTNLEKPHTKQRKKSRLPKPLRKVAQRYRRDRTENVVTGPVVSDQLLFSGNVLFPKMLAGAKTYAEFGMGASSKWVDTHTNAEIHAVDTAKEWVDEVRKATHRPGHSFHHVDLGRVREWGYPISYENRDRFPDYLNGPFQTVGQPDCVLIDGRFRVACFAHTIMMCAPGTPVLFDDYLNRPFYHVVEEISLPVETDHFQALFEVPKQRDFKKLTELRDAFLMVMP